MKFSELHERLRLETWRRIDQGVLSRALLARQTGLAVGHISNFLNWRRRLSLPALDRILQAEALGVEDLAAKGVAGPAMAQRAAEEALDEVPIVSAATAITMPVLPGRAVLGWVHLPIGWLASLPARRLVGRRLWDRFVGVRVTAAQAQAMEPLLRVDAVVVLDRHYNSLAPIRPPHPNLYGVRVMHHLVFRHVVFESGRMVLRPSAVEAPLDVMELSPQESPSDLLVGRVCWCISQV
jgi:hypothetical protein